MIDQGLIQRKPFQRSPLREKSRVLHPLCPVVLQSAAGVWPDLQTCIPRHYASKVRSSAGGQESVRRSCRGDFQFYWALAQQVGVAS